MSEHCMPHFHSTFQFPNIRNSETLVKKQQIAACLEAMVEERRFTYTDIFVKGGRPVSFFSRS